MPPRKKKKQLTTFDEFMGRVVESKRVKAELTVEELAAATGIGYTTLRRRLDGSGFTVLEIERVAAAVNTPARQLVDEAIADFGGMEKLLSGSVSAPTPTLEALPPLGENETDEEHEAAMDRIWEQLGDEDDERKFREEYRTAAHDVDPELAQDEPEHA